MTRIHTMKTAGVVIIFATLTACSGKKAFTVSNTTDRDIADLTKVVARVLVNQYLPDSTLNLPVVAKNEKGTVLPCQCDDIDGDGRWDELAFLCQLKAGESKKVFFEPVDRIPDFPKRTNIRFGRMEQPFDEVSGDLRMKTNDTKFTTSVYQMEGPAWENDFVAFRNYYDARNGIDIFGKTTSAMILDSVGVNGRDYHTLADWGMDILKVGNSLGAGAIAIAIGDSVYRVGNCVEGHYRLIADGPVRAILELTYKNVPAGNRVYDLVHRISISAGDRFYTSTIWMNKLQGDEKLVTGIVNLHNVQADTLSAGEMKVIYSLGNQAISGEMLGMALLIPAASVVKMWEAPAEGTGIVSTHMVALKIQANVPVEFGFLSAWENQDTLIRDKNHFMDLLKEAALKQNITGCLKSPFIEAVIGSEAKQSANLQ
jgi:hypothetical protein